MRARAHTHTHTHTHKGTFQNQGLAWSYHANYYNRYEDFFGSKRKRGGQKEGVDAKKRRLSKKVEVLGDPDDMGMDSEQGDDIDEDDDADDKTKVQPFDPVAFEIQQENICI